MRQRVHQAKEKRASGPPGGGSRGSPFLGRRGPGLAAPEPSLNKPQARALPGACRTAVPMDWFEGFGAVEEAEEGVDVMETIEEEEEDWFEGFEVEEEPRRDTQVEEAAEGGRAEELDSEGPEEEFSFEGFEEEFSFEGFGEGEDEGGGIDQEGVNDEEEEEEREEEVRGAAARDVGRVDGGRIFVGPRSRCQFCGQEKSKTNMARHERRCRLVWDPGGGPHPIQGADGP